VGKRVLVTGGTGLIGARLVAALRERGDAPVVVTRNTARARDRLGAGVDFVEGDPSEAGAWQAAVDGCDAVVNLAGPSIGARRWNAQYRQILLDTRVEITRWVVAAIEAAKARPRVLVSASAVDYYAFAIDLPGESKADADEFAEDAPRGDGFLARLCRDWEEEARRAEAVDCRVVLMRTGVVLAREAEALRKMALPFRFFIGGRLGSGEQFLSWIHLEDAVRGYLFAIDRDDLRGPVNLVAPETIRQAAFAKQLGRALGRPSWLPVPAFALRVAVGGFAEYLLHGRQVVPARLREAGFTWQYPTAAEALRIALGRA